MTETRYQRVFREQQERKAAREQRDENNKKKTSRRRNPDYKSHADRIADRIDGFDRDDLGLSPDY